MVAATATVSHPEERKRNKYFGKFVIISPGEIIRKGKLEKMVRK